MPSCQVSLTAPLPPLLASPAFHQHGHLRQLNYGPLAEYTSSSGQDNRNRTFWLVLSSLALSLSCCWPCLLAPAKSVWSHLSQSRTWPLDRWLAPPLAWIRPCSLLEDAVFTPAATHCGNCREEDGASN